MESKYIDNVHLRIASPDDAASILQVYAPYVKNTAITFEYEVPDLKEFQNRIIHTLKKYPYIVAEMGQEILGYAYTGAFVGRAAYDWAAETTVYLKENQKKKGLGRTLYTVLEAISRAQNILNLNACISSPQMEDAYLTKNSLQFHEHLGYRKIGEFHQCGYKFGTWYNMVWMEKMLGEHPPVPAAVIPFPQLSGETLRSLHIG